MDLVHPEQRVEGLEAVQGVDDDVVAPELAVVVPIAFLRHHGHE